MFRPLANLKSFQVSVSQFLNCFFHHQNRFGGFVGTKILGRPLTQKIIDHHQSKSDSPEGPIFTGFDSSSLVMYHTYGKSPSAVKSAKSSIDRPWLFATYELTGDRRAWLPGIFPVTFWKNPPSWCFVKPLEKWMDEINMSWFSHSKFMIKSGSKTFPSQHLPPPHAEPAGRRSALSARPARPAQPARPSNEAPGDPSSWPRVEASPHPCMLCMWICKYINM